MGSHVADESLENGPLRLYRVAHDHTDVVLPDDDTSGIHECGPRRASDACYSLGDVAEP